MIGCRRIAKITLLRAEQFGTHAQRADDLGAIEVNTRVAVVAGGVGTCRPRAELPIAVAAWAVTLVHESDDVSDLDFEEEDRDDDLIFVFEKWIDSDAEDTPGPRSLAEEWHAGWAERIGGPEFFVLQDPAGPIAW